MPMTSVCNAGVYRKEQWQVPLAAALLELRECAQRQHNHKVHSLFFGMAAALLCRLFAVDVECLCEMHVLLLPAPESGGVVASVAWQEVVSRCTECPHVFHWLPCTGHLQAVRCAAISCEGILSVWFAVLKVSPHYT